MRIISKERLQNLREKYPVGCRVELLRMDDIQAPMIGTKGTVIGVDDIGSIMVSWDTGSSLSVVFGEDLCRRVEDDSKIKEQILAIRDSGETNMFDVRKVQEIALREGYDELLIYLADNVGAYSRFILTGKEA